MALGGGSALDAAKAIALRAANDIPIWEMEYDGPTLAPAARSSPCRRRGDGLEAHPFAVITHEEIGRKDYIGHRSLLPVTTILDPGLTVGLPAAVTAATGVDALTHSLESLLSRNGNPFAEATALGVIRTVVEWLPRAVADGTDLEARSQMLMAAHLRGRAGQRDGVGLVHALGHALERGRLAQGRPWRSCCRRCSRSTRRSRCAMSLVGVARGAPPSSRHSSAPRSVSCDRFLAGVGQRHRRCARSGSTMQLIVVAQDAIDDVVDPLPPRDTGCRSTKPRAIAWIASSRKPRRLSRRAFVESRHDVGPGHEVAVTQHAASLPSVLEAWMRGFDRFLPAPGSTRLLDEGVTASLQSAPSPVDERLHLADEALERLAVRRRLLGDDRPEAQLDVRPSRSAICSGVPFQKVSSSSTSAIGVRLCSIAAFQTRSPPLRSRGG